jgi:hypothetical protein
MDGFIDQMLQNFGVEGTAATPEASDLFVINESPKLDLTESKRFHTFVTKLLYLAKRF